MIKQTSASKPAHGSGSANGSKAPHVQILRTRRHASRAKSRRKPRRPRRTQCLGSSAALPAGLYLFSVKSTAAAPAATRGPLTLPGCTLDSGPAYVRKQVEFIAGPSTHGSWLFTAGDLPGHQISGAGATMVLTSIRAPGSECCRSAWSGWTFAPMRKAPRRHPTKRSPPSPRAAPGIRSGGECQAPAHGRRSQAAAGRGDWRSHPHSRDMKFSNAAWAGRVGPGLWIESFCVKPLELLGANDIEYKGLTGTGFETPWLSEGKMCGTRAWPRRWLDLHCG